MGTTLIFIGFLFLINPDLITLDVIPDWIGYLLIARGLSRLALLEERIAAAKKYAFFLAATSFAKLLSCTITFSTNIESTRLTVCFLFLVAEGAFSYLMCDHAFKGVQYLAIRKDGDRMLKSYDLVRGFTLTFFLVKAAANFLPQLPVIFYVNIDADADQVENFSAMVRSFRTVRSILFIVGSFALVFLGVYTARLLKAYLKRGREDTPFAEGIYLAYEENVTKNESMQTRLGIKSAFFFFFLSFVFLGDLYLDFINMFPKPLFAFFAFLGLRRLAPYAQVKKWHVSLSLVSFFVTLSAYVYRLVRLVMTESEFPYLFPYEFLAGTFAILADVFTLMPFVFVILAVKNCAGKYTAFDYKKYQIALLVIGFLLTGLSFSQYLFVGRSDLVVALQWIFYATVLYLHKSSMDDIYKEAEYHLM